MDQVLEAFEFSKRKFAETHGSELPVWALLSSGATGGVCVSSVFIKRPFSFYSHFPDCLLAILLPVRCLLILHFIESF